jgi:sugar lactone lactonase YvrE
MHEASLLFDSKSQLGEGAIWDNFNSKLYWVDIESKFFHVYDPVTGENQSYYTAKRIGTVVPVDAGNVLLALEDGIASLNLLTGEINYQLQTSIHLQHNRRFNDGKCDPAGRFWVGTLSMEGTREVSSLYCIKGDFNIEEKISGISISNGIAWNADGTRMYYIDTPTKRVVGYNFDLASGSISNPKTIIEIPDNMGYPDGMTIDSEGMLWVALWDGYCVARYDPSTGQLLHKISVPAPKVTSCAFGGEKLNTLFITTARVEMTEEDLRAFPLSGAVFTVDLDIKGVPAYSFNMQIK